MRELEVNKLHEIAEYAATLLPNTVSNGFKYEFKWKLLKHMLESYNYLSSDDINSQQILFD